MTRRSVPGILVAAVFAATFAFSGSSASPSQESSFVSRLNAERTSRGLRAVAVRSDLADVARRWSQQMARDGAISHDPNLPNEVSGWTRLGDNVGRGGDIASIHEAFMDSSTHRSIILEPDFNQVGVGVATASNGLLYVTEVFVRRAVATVTKPQASHPRPAAPRRTRNAAGAIVYEIGLTGMVWAIDLNPHTVTVT